jgi:hypothetical protein
MHRADRRPHSGTLPPLPGARRTVTSSQASTRGQPGAGPARLPSGTSPAESSSTCSAPGSSPKATPLGRRPGPGGPGPGGPGRCHSAARLAALQPPSLLATAAALRHAAGSPSPGLLRRLRPARPFGSRRAYPGQRAGCPPPGAAPGGRCCRSTGRWADALSWLGKCAGSQGRGMLNPLRSADMARYLPMRSVISTTPCRPNADSVFSYRVASTECFDVNCRAYA